MFGNKYFKKVGRNISEWWAEQSPFARRLFWGVIFILSLSLILMYEFIPSGLNLNVGEVSMNDIEAPGSKTFVDQEKTEELREIAARSVSRSYIEDPEISEKIREEVYDLFTLILIEKERRIDGEEGESQSQEILTNTDKNEIVQLVKNNINNDISEETVFTILRLSSEENEELEEITVDILSEKMEEKIHLEDISRVRNELTREVAQLNLDNDKRLALINILETTVRPNMIFDEEATRTKQEEAMSQVEPYTRSVKQGEMIVRKGEIVTEQDIKVLEALGLQKPTINYLSIAGTLIVLIILVVSAAVYFYKYRPELWEEQRKLILMELLIIIVLLIAKAIDVTMGITQLNFLYYLVPVAAVSILITVLIDTNAAFVVTIFTSFLTALIFDAEFNVLITGFIGGLTGIFSVSKMSQRNDLVISGLNVSLVMMALILGLRLTETWYGWLDFLWYISMGLLNGILVAIFANGLLPLMENAFNLTSSVKLLELSSAGHPLLKKLLMEAPGSYHHSIIVSNLAETAADNINADSLLARVGSYYHDIGKMKRPYFFTENIYSDDNPHDKLSANLSALIIKSHVKDGVEMAKEHRLPECVVDIIKQHHGTNLISFFYKQALEDSVHDNLDENDFRYDGPRPRSREAAVIMLADIVEAAVRSKNFNKNNHNRIEGFVRELLRDKLEEGQLDESDLSLKDLDIIAESFVKVLSGIYHQRVEYPESIAEEMKRIDKNGQN